MRRKKKRKPQDSRTKLRRATKAFLLSPAENRCQLCKYNKYMGNLTFHHKNPRQKLFNISSMLLTCPLQKLIREASKCIVVCHNCHGEIHAGCVPSVMVAAIGTLDFANHRAPTNVVQWYKSYCRVLKLAG